MFQNLRRILKRNHVHECRPQSQLKVQVLVGSFAPLLTFLFEHRLSSLGTPNLGETKGGV